MLSCMWLFTFAAFIVFPFQYTGALPVPPNALYAVRTVKRFGFLAIAPVIFFDWFIFGTISLGLLKVFASQTLWRGMCYIFITGADISAIPRALLRNGHPFQNLPGTIIDLVYIEPWKFSMQLSPASRSRLLSNNRYHIGIRSLPLWRTSSW